MGPERAPYNPEPHNGARCRQVSRDSPTSRCLSTRPRVVGQASRLPGGGAGSATPATGRSPGPHRNGIGSGRSPGAAALPTRPPGSRDGCPTTHAASVWDAQHARPRHGPWENAHNPEPHNGPRSARGPETPLQAGALHAPARCGAGVPPAGRRGGQRNARHRPLAWPTPRRHRLWPKPRRRNPPHPPTRQPGRLPHNARRLGVGCATCQAASWSPERTPTTRSPTTDLAAPGVPRHPYKPVPLHAPARCGAGVPPAGRRGGQRHARHRPLAWPTPRRHRLWPRPSHRNPPHPPTRQPGRLPHNARRLGVGCATCQAASWALREPLQPGAPQRTSLRQGLPRQRLQASASPRVRALWGRRPACRAEGRAAQRPPPASRLARTATASALAETQPPQPSPPTHPAAGTAAPQRAPPRCGLWNMSGRVMDPERAPTTRSPTRELAAPGVPRHPYKPVPPHASARCGAGVPPAGRRGGQRNARHRPLAWPTPQRHRLWPRPSHRNPPHPPTRQPGRLPHNARRLGVGCATCQAASWALREPLQPGAPQRTSLRQGLPDSAYNRRVDLPHCVPGYNRARRAAPGCDSAAR